MARSTRSTRRHSRTRSRSRAGFGSRAVAACRSSSRRSCTSAIRTIRTTARAGSTPPRTCAGCCTRPTACSCRRARSATPLFHSECRNRVCICKGWVSILRNARAEIAKSARRVGRAIRMKSSSGTSRTTASRRGPSICFGRRSGRGRMGRDSASCSRGRRCRTFARSGPASKSRIASRGSACSPTKQKRDFFAGIDAFALPSRTDSFGLVLLEAWANGKPNLVYRAGGPAELVRDGIDGLHARCGDIEQLSEQLRRLVTDAGMRRDLGERGRARIATEFRWEDKLEMVRSVMASGGRMPRPCQDDTGGLRPLARRGLTSPSR